MQNYPNEKQLELLFEYCNNKPIFEIKPEWTANFNRYKLYNTFLAYASCLDILSLSLNDKLNKVIVKDIIEEINTRHKNSEYQFNKNIILSLTSISNANRVWVSLDKYPTWHTYYMQISTSFGNNKKFTIYHELSHILLHQQEQYSISEILSSTAPIQLKWQVDTLFAESYSDIMALIYLFRNHNINIEDYTDYIINRRSTDVDNAIKKHKLYLSLVWESPFGHDTREALYLLKENAGLIRNNIKHTKWLNELSIHMAYIGILRTINRLLERHNTESFSKLLNMTLLNNNNYQPIYQFINNNNSLLSLNTKTKFDKIKDLLNKKIFPITEKKESEQLNLF